MINKSIHFMKQYPFTYLITKHLIKIEGVIGQPVVLQVSVSGLRYQKKGRTKEKSGTY